MGGVARLAHRLARVSFGAVGKKAKKKPTTGADGTKVVALNRRARFNYQVEESMEAGLMLAGTEVKAAREGGVNLTDSYVRLVGDEAWLVGCRFDPYAAAAQFNHEPDRERKLLLHRRELDRLITKVREKGLALLVTKVYFKNGILKAELSLARGKKSYDKRATIKERVVKKEMDRAMKHRNQ